MRRAAPAEALAAAFAPVRAAAAPLGLEEGTSYRTPALKRGGKLVARMKDAATLVLHCPEDRKAFLLACEPELFFETDHYRGWPYVLLRLDRVAPARLAEALAEAAQARVPPRRRAAAA